MKIPTRIETDRLVLRPFNEGDLEPYLRFMLDPEATKALLRYAFRELGIREVYAHASPDNPRSWQVAEKSGMTYRGMAQYRGNDFTGKVFSISSPEFESSSSG